MREPGISKFQRQHGLISRDQARTEGLSRSQIYRRVVAGAWIEVYPGVYRHAAHPVTPEQEIMAATLSAGPGAVASHQAAAYLWGLLDWNECGGRAAVTVPSSAHPRGPRFDVHRSGNLDWTRVRLWHGIECTDPLWTMVDIAATMDGAVVDAAIDQALARKLVTIAGLQAEITRRGGRGRRGTGRLSERLALRGFIGAPGPSVLESRAMAFLRRYRIPVEAAEVVAGPDGEYRVDFALVQPVMWEVDGYVWHFSPEQASRDADRRNQLKLEGIDLYVTTWLQLRRNQSGVARMLRQAISRVSPGQPGPASISSTTLTSVGWRS